MELFFTLMVLLIGAAFLSIKFNKRIEETIICYIFLTIILLYMFGCFGALNIGAWTFLGITFILMLLTIAEFVKSTNKKEIMKNIFTPGLFIFLILNCIILIFQRGRMFSQWDEFSHWGSVVKSMFYTNKLSVDPNSTLLFKAYPPTLAIFEYLFVFIKRQFVEYYVYIAYEIFCLALFLPFTTKLEWNNKTKIICYAVIMFITPMLIFKDFYNIIYIDAALGLTFGFCIAFIIKNKEQYKLYDMILLSGALFNLVLLKDAGLFLAIIVAILFIIDFIFIKKQLKKGKAIIYLLLPIVLIIASKCSWNLLIKINNVDTMSYGKYNISEFFKIIIGKETSYKKDVMRNFIEACFKNKKIFQTIVELSTVELTIVCTIAIIYLYKKNNYTKREKYCLEVLIIGLFVYLLGLMATYIYKFVPNSALNLESFDRYVKIYFEGIALVISFMILENKNIDKKTLVIITLIILLFSPLDNIRKLRISTDETIEKRKNYSQSTDIIEGYVDKDKSVFIIDKENPDFGLTYWVTRYSLIPRKTNNLNMFNITTVKEKENSYLVYYPFEEIKDTIMKDYDYVYIKNIDENFENEYGNLFENLSEDSLYKVDDNKLIKIY